MQKKRAKYQSSKINQVLSINPGSWFVADIIGLGIYEMVGNGINHIGNTSATVKLKKLFNEGFKNSGHETTCHPIDTKKWDSFKIVKL